MAKEPKVHPGSETITAEVIGPGTWGAEGLQPIGRKLTMPCTSFSYTWMKPATPQDARKIRAYMDSKPKSATHATAMEDIMREKAMIDQAQELADQKAVLDARVAEIEAREAKLAEAEAQAEAEAKAPAA